MIITHHFVLTVMPDYFRAGETVAARRDQAGDIIGLDRVDEVTRVVIGPIDGYIAEDAPLDERTQLPMSIDGVQLWRAY